MLSLLPHVSDSHQQGESTGRVLLMVSGCRADRRGWSPALLWCHWSRGWWPRWEDVVRWGNPRSVAGQGHYVLPVPLGPWLLAHLFLRYGFFPAGREVSPSEVGIHISTNSNSWQGLRRKAFWIPILSQTP